MAHVVPGDYSFHHGREAPYGSSTGILDYYAGQGDHPAAFRRPLPPYPYSSHPDIDPPALSGMVGMSHVPSTRGRQPPAGNKEIVVQAIEAASAVLRDQALALREQIAENERLRSALRVRDWELHNYRIDHQGHGLRSGEVQALDDVQAIDNALPIGTTTNERGTLMHGTNQTRGQWAGEDLQSSLIVHPDARTLSENHHRYSSNGLQAPYSSSGQGVNGAGRPRHQQEAGFSQTSSPSARSPSPSRHAREVDSHNVRMVPEGHAGVDETSTSNGQDSVQSAPRLLEEIKHLKLRLSDTTMKEMQLVRENGRLEKRLAELRATIEKYQQELVDAKSRVMAAQQEVLEENAQLTAGLRDAEQDRNFYASSLLPLLAEFHLAPATTRDPHSIVSGIKTLIQHFRDELRKESMLSKQPWRTSPTYHPSQPFTPSSRNLMSGASQSPEHHGLEIVPAQYLQSDRPVSPTSPFSHTPREWEQSGALNQHHAFGIENYSSDHAQRSYHGESLIDQQHDENYASTGEDSNANEPPFGHDAPEKTSQLSTLPEEPQSSISDDEDPLPDIDGLSIQGDAILGNKMTACGISINGTTLCHFQWVRHHRDGHLSLIPGAAQPDYVVTADDVDTMLSLECTPMDDRNRKGDMVRVYANNQNLITLENDMKEQINDYLDAEQAFFDVKVVVENAQDISFEPASLALKRSTYELKKNIGKRLLMSDRYAMEASGNIVQLVDISVGKDSQCVMVTNGGIVQYLNCDNNRTRDLLVLTLREFVKLAIDKKRAKKKSWLIKK